MTGYIKKPHTSIFIGQTGCGKTHLVLELIEKEYKNHFDYIIIICPTLLENDTYDAKEGIKNDDKVGLVDPKENLYQWIKKLSELLRFLKVLFIKDDMTRGYANECLDKRRQPLLEGSISGRHPGHYLWLLAQSHTAIPKNLRRQAKAIFVWYPKERADLKTIHDENDVLTDHELVIGRGILRKSKHACLYIRNEFPRGFRLLNHVGGAYFKGAKWTHLNVAIYFSIYCDNHNTRGIRSFPHQQTGPVLQWKISCWSHIGDKCATSFQGLHVVFQAAL